jgi:hypothetical protein
MKISKKRPPVLLDQPELSRAIEQIYDNLNEIIDSINSSAVSEDKNEYTGKVGDIRINKRADSTYEIQGKTKEGWAGTPLEIADKSNVQKSVTLTRIDDLEWEIVTLKARVATNETEIEGHSHG